MPKSDVNELLEMWNEIGKYLWIRNKKERGKSMDNWFDYKMEREGNIQDIMKFWSLKAKIDALKKEIEDLRFLSQPTPLTDEEFIKRIREYEDD
jgi:hypothetical protein